MKAGTTSMLLTAVFPGSSAVPRVQLVLDKYLLNK